jgi:hypothetical protein
MKLAKEGMLPTNLLDALNSVGQLAERRASSQGETSFKLLRDIRGALENTPQHLKDQFGTAISKCLRGGAAGIKAADYLTTVLESGGLRFFGWNFSGRVLSDNLKETLIRAVDFHCEFDDYQGAEDASLLAARATSPGVDDFMIEAYRKGLDNGMITDPLTSRRVLGEAIAQSSVKSIITNGPDWQSIYDYRFATKGLPLGLWRHFEPTRKGKEILYNLDWLIDGFRGFRADTYTARRPPGQGTRSLLEQFGRDVGEVSIINQKDREGFPGPGLVIEKIDPEKAFEAHIDFDNADPLHVYRKIWPAVAREIDDIASTRYFISRAFIAITPPQLQKYHIPSPDGEDAGHYSLVIFNANHGNLTNDTAFLVPTEVLDKAFADRTVKVHPEVVIPDELKDMNEAELRPEDLWYEAGQIGKHVIEVGSAAVASGHYEYAYPANADDVERPLYTRPVGRLTIYGTPEPSVQSDPFLHQGEERRDLSTSKLHNDIQKSVKSQIELWRGLKFIRASWSKGNTASEPVDVDFTEEELEDALAAEGLPHWWDSSSTRMLIEAYRWNEGRAPESEFSRKDDPEAFPVLVLASSQRHAERPNKSLFEIDTFAGKDGEPGMTFRDRNGKKHTINTASRGRGLEDAVFFIREVLQYAPDDSLELRFYDRRSLEVPG